MGRTNHTVSRAGFIADHHSIVRDPGRQIDWARVSTTSTADAVTATVSSAGAAANATSVPVAALSGAIPSGTLLSFDTKKFAKLTAAAAKGATSLTVEALPTALADGDAATYAGTGRKYLPAGTVVGDLLGSGKVSPRVVTTNPAMGVLETDAIEGDPTAAKSGYGVIRGGALYEALLPDASGSPRVLAGAIKTELNASGTGFVFLTYSDQR